ncbi:MAG: division/cell wall cluster transcriptional repressor MraZ [Deltaproteobacteria bacterium]|nr:division/cell wall cluster transcriptional repressor MraZ [Deltaproteobacteria bacterium]
MDDKGRVSVPAKFRDFLLAASAGRVVITNFFSESARCLDAYPYPAWVEFEKRLRERPQFDNKMMRFQNYYLAGAHECEIDKQGRILLPPALRTYAGLARDVTFVGIGEKFRIWDRGVWTKVFADSEQAFMDDPGMLSDLGI